MNRVFDVSTRLSHARKADAALRAGIFHAHPDDVLADPSLNRDEKRALLASWLSDARGVADAPGLRRLDSGAVIDVDDVFAALRSLDDGAETSSEPGSKRPEPPRPLTFGRAARRSPVSRLFSKVTRRDDDDDPPPCPAAAARPVRLLFVDADGARGGLAPGGRAAGGLWPVAPAARCGGEAAPSPLQALGAAA